MKYRALKSFCGKINMGIGEEREIEKSLAESLVKIGYLEPTEVEEKPKKKPKKDE